MARASKKGRGRVSGLSVKGSSSSGSKVVGLSVVKSTPQASFTPVGSIGKSSSSNVPTSFSGASASATLSQSGLSNVKSTSSSNPSNSGSKSSPSQIASSAVKQVTQSVKPLSAQSNYTIIGGKAVPKGAVDTPNISITKPRILASPATQEDSSKIDQVKRDRALEIFSSQHDVTAQIAKNISDKRFNLMAQGYTVAEAQRMATKVGITRDEMSAINSSLQKKEIIANAQAIQQAEILNKSLSGIVVTPSDNPQNIVKVRLDKFKQDDNPRRTRLQVENALASGSKPSDIKFDVVDEFDNPITTQKGAIDYAVIFTGLDGLKNLQQPTEFLRVNEVTGQPEININAIFNKVNPRVLEGSIAQFPDEVKLRNASIFKTPTDAEGLAKLNEAVKSSEIAKEIPTDVFTDNISYRIKRQGNVYTVFDESGQNPKFESTDIGAITDFLLKNNYISFVPERISAENIDATKQFLEANKQYSTLFLLLQEIVRINTNVSTLGEIIQNNLRARNAEIIRQRKEKGLFPQRNIANVNDLQNDDPITRILKLITIPIREILGGSY